MNNMDDNNTWVLLIDGVGACAVDNDHVVILLEITFLVVLGVFSSSFF